MAQAAADHSPERRRDQDVYLIEEGQFVRLATLHQAVAGLAALAGGRTLDDGQAEPSIERDQLAAIFLVLGAELKSIAGDLPVQGLH